MTDTPKKCPCGSVQFDYAGRCLACKIKCDGSCFDMCTCPPLNFEKEFDTEFSDSYTPANHVKVGKNKDDIKAFIRQTIQAERERCANIVRNHRLSDWSGEAEVEAELEQIALKIVEGN